jgi:lysine 2,3-aminomutase
LFATRPAAAENATCIVLSYYDRENGIAVYTAPSVKPDKFFLYFDPIDTLPIEAQGRWQSPMRQQQIIAAAIKRAGGRVEALA